jgi:hypothetical protein
VFGEASRSGNKDYLIKRIGWRIQSLAEGGLSERAKARAAELARDADIRATVPRTTTPTTVTLPGPPMNRRLPMSGAVLTRHYQGRLIQVTVPAKGFEWEGNVYRSLTCRRDGAQRERTAVERRGEIGLVGVERPLEHGVGRGGVFNCAGAGLLE